MSLRVWVLCLYFMGLHLSNQQTALELGLCGSDVQAMTEQLRCGLVAKTPKVELTGEVEPDARASSGIDKVYVVTGHKGQPEQVAKRGGLGAVAGWQVRRARHAGEGQAAHPWPDPAWWPNGIAYAGRRAAGHDQADRHSRRRHGQANTPEPDTSHA